MGVMESDSTRKMALTTAIRVAFRKFYSKFGMQDPDALARAIVKEVGYLWAANDDRVREFYVKAMWGFVAPKRRADTQLDLYEDLEQPMPLLHDDGARSVKVLGDFDLADIPLHTRQVRENVEKVTAAEDRWLRKVALIEPVLRAHDGWVWRDAVDYLRERGALPDQLGDDDE
jgi:hypothetical protein